MEAALVITHQKPNWQTTIPSPELDARLATLRSPNTLPEWLEALGARVVTTPATGGCLYFAMHGTRTRSLHGANMTLCPTHVKEGGYYKKHIFLTLELFLEPMLDDGTLVLNDFSRRCFQNGIPDDRREALAALRSYLASVRKASVKSLTREQWGGDEEIYAAARFLRDPIFALAVDPQGLTSIRALWLDRPHPRGPERIIHHLPPPGEAFETIRVFLQHRVTPMVLVHTADHFNCVRFPEQLYQRWTADDISGTAMRDRMDQALAQLGWYVAPRTVENIPLAQPTSVHLHKSGSLYTPPEDCSDASEAALLPATADPLSPTAYYALLRSINPRRRRRGPLALIWAQAERLNRNAYEEWNKQQTYPATEAGSQTLTAASRAWSGMPPAFLSLLRALPYPEATISLLPEDIVRRLGNELNDLAQLTGLPSFIAADDSDTTQYLWAQLPVLVAVALDEATDDAIVTSIRWLRHQQETTLHVLHAIRLHDWTPIAELARAITSLSAPTGPDAWASEADRL